MAAQSGKRILIIDDDIVTQEAMSTILAGDGHRVAAACNGQDALQRLLAYEKPDLILLDLKMPVMDGCSFCRARSQNKELASIPVVIISAMPDGAEQAAALGAVLYLAKPIDVVTLLSELRRCCRPEGIGAGAGI
jgi:two-component system cell cycle response regulator